MLFRRSILLFTVVLLALTGANCFFFNLQTFLEPVMEPNVQTFGSAIYHDDKKNKDIIIPFDSRKQNDEAAKNDSKKLGIVRKEKKNLRRWNDDVAKDIYQVAGIPQNIIYNKILPVHMVARYDLNRFFLNGSSSKQRLYVSLKRLKDLIQWITQKYLKNINNIILGSSNQVIGHNIYVKADHHKIKGQSNFVFNPHFQQKIIRGDNIVRIGRFDINLQKIQRVKVDPYQTVKILQE